MPIDQRYLQLSSTLNAIDNRWDAMSPDEQRRMEEVVERIAAITAKASDIGIATGVGTEGEAVRIPKVSGLSIDEQLTCVELLAANIEEWQQGSEVWPKTVGVRLAYSRTSPTQEWAITRIVTTNEIGRWVQRALKRLKPHAFAETGWIGVAILLG